MTRKLALHAFRSRLRRFAGGEHGLAAIEFALVVPVMVLLVLGCFEVPRYVLIYQKMARASAGVADLVAQADEPLLKNQLDDIFIAGRTMMEPYDLAANGRMIVSSINNPGGAGVTITWQRPSGTVTTASKLGGAGANPSGAMPAGLPPGSNEEVLAAEVYFNYVPIFQTLIYSGKQLYIISYTRPRNHNLTTPPPTS